jgi:hypothetical protein
MDDILLRLQVTNGLLKRTKQPQCLCGFAEEIFELGNVYRFSSDYRFGELEKPGGNLRYWFFTIVGPIGTIKCQLCRTKLAHGEMWRQPESQFPVDGGVERVKQLKRRRTIFFLSKVGHSGRPPATGRDKARPRDSPDRTNNLL